LLIFFSAFAFGQFGEEEEHQIVLMGKVTHAEYGSPIKNYEVYIISDSIESGIMDYYNVVRTDEEGFYYDTISTFLNDGTLLVYTFDFDDSKLEQEVHFRFMNSNNDNIFINNFGVHVPFQKPILQAQFTIFQNENLGKLHFAFFDQTDNDFILSWKWNFGDNTISTVQNPKHTFPGPGTYKVELTVEAIVFEHVEVNTISQYIYIPAFAYYHLGGHCFADDYPIDNGLAYLYYYSDVEHLKAIDTAEIDTLGYYYFYQVQEGNYYVKAQPSKTSDFYSTLIPTYYGGEMFWENAQFVEHDHTNWEYDIQLIEGLGTAEGEGLIAGQVTIGESLMYIADDNVENIDVYLLDENENPLSSRYTDEEGNFDFENIALDTYWMCQEMTGVPKNKVRIELNEEKPVVNDIEIDLITGDITLDINENKWFREAGNPYPNPAANRVTINLDVKSSVQANLQLIDLQGRMIRQQNVDLFAGLNQINLELDGMQNGYYFIRVTSEGSSFDKPLVISR
jgi:PKD repeat protein